MMLLLLLLWADYVEHQCAVMVVVVVGKVFLCVR